MGLRDFVERHKTAHHRFDADVEDESRERDPFCTSYNSIPIFRGSGEGPNGGFRFDLISSLNLNDAPDLDLQEEDNAGAKRAVHRSLGGNTRFSR